MVWVTGGVPTLLVSWISGHRLSPNHATCLSWKAKKLTLRNFFTFLQTTSIDDARKSISWNGLGYGDGCRS